MIVALLMLIVVILYLRCREEPYYGFVEKQCPCCREELNDMKIIKNVHDSMLLANEIDRRTKNE